MLFQKASFIEPSEPEQNPKKIVYSGVGKTKEEISYALNNKILCFNVESEEELNAINEQASLMKLRQMFLLE